METMRTLLFSGVLLTGMIACSSPSEPSGPDTDDLARELARNQLTFQTRIGGSYRITVQNNCFCPLEVLRPVRLTVRNGAITEAVRRSDNTALPPAEWRAYRTVDGVFAEISAGLRRGARRVAVDYDSRDGYPRETLIDDQMAADAFVGFSLSDLEDLP